MLSKNICYTLSIVVLLTSCALVKKTEVPDYNSVIYTDNQLAASRSLSKPAANTPQAVSAKQAARTTTATTAESSSVSGADSVLKVKYANHLKVPTDSIKNIKLYQFIDEWLYTPYLWGGTSKRGIDCSAFMQRLLAEVYDIYIPRTSFEQYLTENVEPFTSVRSLSEGDLIFFKTLPGNPVTHVGMYLGNNIFINSSSSKGVSFGSLRDYYWASKYVSSGRLVVHKSKRVAKN